MLCDIYEFKELCVAEEVELEALWAKLSEVVDDNFAVSLSEEGCARWERMLKLTLKATDTTEDRRFRILAAINREIPYTIRGLERQLSVLCGSGGYSAEFDAGNYTISIKLALETWVYTATSVPQILAYKFRTTISLSPATGVSNCPILTSLCP